MEVQGMSLESQLLRKAPDKFLMNMSMGGNIIQSTSFDGSAGKSSGMQGEKVLEGEELENLKIQSRFLPELDYGGEGYTLSLLTIEKINGADAYKLELEDPSGATSLVYYDVESSFRIREEKTEVSPGGPVLQSTTYGDYKEVDGIMYPHKIEMSFGPQTISGTAVSVKFNSGIEDSVFN